ncbi:MAG: hypothetical protein J1F63_06785 [Oscillospiraceae bacterium]|nr:hypothetical protein [Oscillospiraceae bacterium]
MTAFEKFRNAFWKFPILVSLAIGMVPSVLFWLAYAGEAMLNGESFFAILSELVYSFIIMLLIYPIELTVLNLLFLLVPFKDERAGRVGNKFEIVTAALGILLSGYYLSMGTFSNIMFVEWSEQIYNDQVHFPLSLSRLAVVIIIAVLAAIAYIRLKTVKPEKWPPLLAALSIGAVYVGAALCVVWCVQICAHEPILALFPANCVIFVLKLVRDLARAEGPAKDWPWMGLLGALPALGIIIAIDYLLGGQPDDIVKVWTETADWTLSQQIAPPPLESHGHYLCTVAAQGHKKVVKPLRPGLRHGRLVTVNRQLCVANAFEQLLEERTPRLHKAVRGFYDRHGFPVSQLIDKKWKADLVYIAMKPAEWFFLFWLYLLDQQPERRISVQYPLTELYGDAEPLA